MYAYNYLQSHRYLKILYQWLCCLFTVQCRQLNEPIQESCRIIYGHSRHSIYDFFHTFIIIDVSRFNLKIGIYVGKESFFFLNWRISSYKSYLLTYVRIYQSKKLQYFHILRCLLQHSWNYLLRVWLEKSLLIFSGEGLIVIFFVRFWTKSIKCYNKKYQIQNSNLTWSLVKCRGMSELVNLIFFPLFTTPLKCFFFSSD